VPEGDSMTTAIVKAEPLEAEICPDIEVGIFPASQSPESLTDDQLAEIAVGTFRRIQDSVPYIIELRKRFKAAPRGKANIAGCDTWEQFCEKHLHRTASALRKALQAERSTTTGDLPEYNIGSRLAQFIKFVKWLSRQRNWAEHQQAIGEAVQLLEQLRVKPEKKRGRNTSLSPETEALVRRDYESGKFTQQHLAERYAVTQGTISNIIKRAA
jgi:hypothetical protein